jgi:hypothetical protein
LQCQLHYCLHMWCWFVMDEGRNMFPMLHLENVYVGGQWETSQSTDVFCIHILNSRFQACMHCSVNCVGDSSRSKVLCCWWAYNLHIRKQGVGPGSGIPRRRLGSSNPPKFWSFGKAEPNSQFCGKYIRNNLIRIWVSLILQLEWNPWLEGYHPQIPVLSASVLSWIC